MLAPSRGAVHTSVPEVKGILVTAPLVYKMAQWYMTGTDWTGPKPSISKEVTILKSPDVSAGTRHEYVHVLPQPYWKLPSATF